ncbi:MAG: dihydroorotase family protein, partial [Bdellovibrionales bacterium]|nr:dihydroorotase family protein [Bdellovibrionales bacterium]
ATEELMTQAFERLQHMNLPLLQHAEIPGHGGVLAPGPAQRTLGVAPYFDDPEVEMVRRDLRLLEKFPKARYHVLHISSARVVPLLKAAKAQGLKVTGEVTPHHLLLSTDDIDPNDSSFKMNPPLRSSADRIALINALKEGFIDWCATDHAPHEPAAKGTDFKAAAFGTVALESFFRTLLGLYHAGHLTRERLVQVFSTKPARFLGLGDEWGQIKTGLPLRAILVDPDRLPQPVTNLELHSQSLNSCFHHAPVPGQILSHFTTQGRFDLGGMLV